MKKVCIVATVPYALVMFMKPHIMMLSKHYDVTLIANGTEQDVATMLGSNVRFIKVNFARKISLWRDLVTLIQLYQIFRKEQFEVVHSLMPKTALLAMIAALIARVPNRIHTFTGQVWANKKGLSRWGLKILDRLVVSCASGLLADSFSQRQFLIEQRIVKKNKIIVLANGSVCGVDVKRFKPDLKVRHQIRSELNIPNHAIIYLFVGRLNKDKGILDLATAFASLAISLPNIHLLVVGPSEDGIDIELQLILTQFTSQFHRVGFTDKPELYMACADIFCLSSYREGFGSVIIEAAAAGLPAVASRIYGLVDAVKNSETGILHQPKNIEEIKIALLTMTKDSVREKMSNQALLRTRSLFTTEVVVNAMSKYYQSLLD